MDGVNIDGDMLRNFKCYVPGDPVLKYKLMLKSHYETGIHYLCITNRKNWEDYKGSGKRWRSLLKKYPSRIITELIYTTDSKEDLAFAAMYHSIAYDIPNNPIFSNLVPELGYEGNQGNFPLWWEGATEEERNAVFEQRQKSLKEYYNTDEGKQNAIDRGIRRQEWLRTEEGIQCREEVSKKLIEMYETEAGQARRQYMSEYMTEYAKQNPAYRELLSKNIKAAWNGLTDEERYARGRNVSKGRLAMSDEAKALRAQRMSVSLKNSDSRKSFNKRLKEERLGGGNPRAVGVYWYGQIFQSKKEFCAFIKENNMNKYHTLLMLDDPTNGEVYAITREMKKNKLNEPIVCPHCGASTLYGNHTKFMNFHNDNCKHK